MHLGGVISLWKSLASSTMMATELVDPSIGQPVAQETADAVEAAHVMPLDSLAGENE